MSLKLTLKNVPPTYSCDRCAEVCKSPLHLKYHKFRVHNKCRPYICKECNKAFRRINELQLHRRRHKHNSRPFVCSVCDVTFASRNFLCKHLGTHVHYEGDHECGYCAATFLNLAEAKLHVLLVHGDSSVLPQPRQVKVANTAHSSEDVFCIKEGDGLKIKFKRKLSTDINYEDHHGTTDDLNPGSHTSDSGKGNSDMDEEDSRYGSHLLRSPTFVPRFAEPARNHKLFPESGLLVKPKLELGQTQWGGSKIQPSLTSKDFLTKTKFNSSFNSNLWANSGGFISPNQNLVTTSSPSRIQSSQDNQKGTSALQPCSPLSNMVANSFHAQTKPPFLMHIGTSLQTNMINGGNLLKPSIFPMNGISSTPRFGASTFPGMISSPAQFQSSASAGFAMNKLGFNNTRLAGFGQSSFGALQHLGSLTTSFGSNIAKTGEVSNGLIFGTKAKVRSMVAESGESVPNAFVQYAGSSDVTKSNPFAEAMKRAKNPPKRRPSLDLLSETSSSYSESEESDSGVSSSTGESEEQEISDIDDVSAPPSSAAVLDSLIVSDFKPAISSPGAPLLWTTPAPIDTIPILPIQPSPLRTEPASKAGLLLSEKMQACLEQVPVAVDSYLLHHNAIPASKSPTHPLQSPSLRKSRNSLSATPYRDNSESHISVDALTTQQSAAKVSDQHNREQKSSNIPSKSPLVNGGLPERLSEVSGLIDLDTPSLSICIPKELLKQASNVKSKLDRRTSSKLSKSPAHVACPTPSLGYKTPSYHLLDQIPATPVLHDHSTDENIDRGSYKKPMIPRKPAPTKQEMMERMKAQAKVLPKPKIRPKIGPKSYLRKINAKILSDSEDELSSLDLDDRFSSKLSARTDYHAVQEARFKQSHLYVCYLRRRAIDLILCLFPKTRIGGNFCADTEDVEGLLDYLILSLENKDTSKRCVHSIHSSRKSSYISLCRSNKQVINLLTKKICKLLRLVLPSLTLPKIEQEGINTLPKLIYKIIKENS